MNKRLQGFAAGILCCVLFAGISVFAKNATETIQAMYKDIKIYVDGVKIDPKDANGNKVEPFIYNGTTYLPVRAIGDAIGKQVAWDGATSSVYLGEKPGDTQYLIDVCPPYDSSRCELYTMSNGKSFLMGGKKFTNGFTLENYSWAEGEIYFNLDAKYKSITLNMGPVDGTGFFKENTTIGFYVDDKLVKEYIVKPGDLPQQITVPVNYGMKLKVIHNERDADIGFGNITVE